MGAGELAVLAQEVGDTVRQAACTADALTGLLGTATANGAACR